MRQDPALRLWPPKNLGECCTLRSLHCSLFGDHIHLLRRATSWCEQHASSLTPPIGANIVRASFALNMFSGSNISLPTKRIHCVTSWCDVASGTRCSLQPISSSTVLEQRLTMAKHSSQLNVSNISIQRSSMKVWTNNKWSLSREKGSVQSLDVIALLANETHGSKCRSQCFLHFIDHDVTGVRTSVEIHGFPVTLSRKSVEVVPDSTCTIQVRTFMSSNLRPRSWHVEQPFHGRWGWPDHHISTVLFWSFCVFCVPRSFVLPLLRNAEWSRSSQTRWVMWAQYAILRYSLLSCSSASFCGSSTVSRLYAQLVVHHRWSVTRQSQSAPAQCLFCPITAFEKLNGADSWLLRDVTRPWWSSRSKSLYIYPVVQVTSVSWQSTASVTRIREDLSQFDTGRSSRLLDLEVSSQMTVLTRPREAPPVPRHCSSHVSRNRVSGP